MSSTISQTKTLVLRASLTGVVALLALWSPSALAIYDSGFDPAASLGDYVADGTNNTIVLPESGVLHYDSFTIPEGETVTFQKNADNTGVWILSGGDVSIEGVIDISGKSATTDGNNFLDSLFGRGGEGGPGGSNGGLVLDPEFYHPANPLGVSDKLDEYGDRLQAGLGPAGGGRMHGGGSPLRIGVNGNQQPPQTHEPWGQTGWIHLSGGGGSGPWRWVNSLSSAGGGGLITIASNTLITVNGSINAAAKQITYGGGGIVRLIADTVGGAGLVDVRSNTASNAASGAGGYGALKVEAFFFEGSLVNNTLPNNAEPIISAPGVALPYPESERPRLEITSVNDSGPSGTVGSWPPNAQLTTGVTIEVIVKGEYMPVGQEGLVVQLNCGGIEPIQYTDGVLLGSFEESFATVSITIPPGTSAGHIEAWWVDPLPITAGGN